MRCKATLERRSCRHPSHEHIDTGSHRFDQSTIHRANTGLMSTLLIEFRIVLLRSPVDTGKQMRLHNRHRLLRSNTALNSTRRYSTRSCYPPSLADMSSCKAKTGPQHRRHHGHTALKRMCRLNYQHLSRRRHRRDPQTRRCTCRCTKATRQCMHHRSGKQEPAQTLQRRGTR